MFESRTIIDPNFTGRSFEIEWLRNHFLRGASRYQPIIISGPSGVGKTSLVQNFVASSRISSIPLWLDLSTGGNPYELLDIFLKELYDNRPKRDFLAVIDGAEFISDEKIRSTISSIFNIKATRGLIFISRNSPKVERADFLELQPFAHRDSLELINKLLNNEITPETLELLISQSQGNPFALKLLNELLSSGNPKDLSNILSGKVYDLNDKFEIPESEIITSIRPSIISANDYVIAKLRKQPESIFSLEPRKFEELLAELLTDMGWDVELTKATRDGGKDILAYLDTDLGKILCLVEAKRYRSDRTVGVDLVRNLFGTLCDHQANSAMLITTSSFSQDAIQFQQRHKYQLNLRDYGDVVKWIQNYKNRAGII